MKSIALILPAAGKGTRMGFPIPKVFIKINDKTILEHTIDCFLSFSEIKQVIVPVSPDMVEEAKLLLKDYGKLIQVIEGGNERMFSIQNALRVLNNGIELVAVHDAARPLVSVKDLENVFKAASENGAAILATPSINTLKKVDDNGNVLKTVERSTIWNALTPQVFNRKVIIEAYDRIPNAKMIATDDAGLVELSGYSVKIVEGNSNNIKLTHKSDLDIAKTMLNTKKPTFRIGQGYDVHRLKEGRKLILGGVEIPFDKGLDGHSDADVLLHAIIDAIIGALALGDIGSHFPDTDKAFKNINSALLLEKVIELINVHGYSIVNIDSTIVAEKPKLRLKIDQMRERIADILGMNMDLISVKATTSEKIGFVGREEGMAATAIVLLQRQDK